MSTNNDQYSIYAVSRELVNEVCGIARVEDHGGFPVPSLLSQSEKRLLIRSVFSYIEALSYLLKVHALSETEGSTISSAEKMIAEEVTFELGDDGTVKARPAKLRTISNIRFAFKVFKKASGSSFELNLDSNGWQCIQRSLKVRDRLTHPKGLSDLTVLDNEYDDSYKAFIWFERQMMLAMEARIQALRETNRALRVERGLEPIEPEAKSSRPAAKRPDHLDDDV
jgi:hypothetical protein